MSAENRLIPALARDPNLEAIYREAEAAVTRTAPDLTRRTFLKLTGLAGGGLALGIWMDERSAALAQTRGAGMQAAEFVPNAFVQVSTDGSILIYSKSPEVGQGIKTAFPMIVAEELDADWADVRVEQSPINEAVYARQAAGGSRSIPEAWDQLRHAGATARAMLISAAAEAWGVPAAECATEPSVVVHGPTGRRLGYGALAERAAALPVPDATAVPLKAREDYRLLGTRVSGVDNHAVVTGGPLFGTDQSLPGMRYAAYAKCPATGGRVRSANLEEIRALPGVEDAFVLEGNDIVTELMSGVAIVADSTWAALHAKSQLEVDWDESEASKDSWSGLDAEARALAGQAGEETVREFGDVDAAFAEAAQTLEAFYAYPFVSHAPLEPQNCTAWYRDGAVEIWAPTQTPHRALSNVSNTLGIPEDRVTLHQTRIGGGFGRRLMNDYVCEAVAISRHIGAPVKLQWSREDDMAHDFYRPGGFHSLKASLDAAGRLSGWEDHFITFTHDGRRPVSGGDTRGGEFPEGLVESYKLTQTMLPLGTPTGPWRAPRSNAIAFAVQSFHHELAEAAGRDHLEFLLEIMGEPRWLEPGNPGALNTGRAAAVIRLAAERAGWGRPLPPGRGLGLAFYFCHAGHFAEVAEVSVDGNRRLTVHRVTVAGDIGPIVNLSGAENQCQGAVMDGLSTMLGLEITMENGRVQESNFHQYPVMRMGNAPVVDVHFLQSDYSPTGVGEPALPPLAPAVCNAIYAATGHRVRTLPLSREGFTA
jgi:isoquinoline 1-oxidoreductase beta subunit